MKIRAIRPKITASNFGVLDKTLLNKNYISGEDVVEIDFNEFYGNLNVLTQFMTTKLSAIEISNLLDGFLKSKLEG
jgi:hypothetical protein